MASTWERLTIGDLSSISSRTKSPPGVRPAGFFRFWDTLFARGIVLGTTIRGANRLACGDELLKLADVRAASTILPR